MNKAIGGFLELEELIDHEKGHFHNGQDTIRMFNGRCSFYYFLLHVRPNKVWLPFYCCDSILIPLKLLQIPYSYYAVSEKMLPKLVPDFAKSDLLVLINYFGIISNAIEKWILENHIENCVLDNTQAFFYSPDKLPFFNSCRKFFGVTNGSYLGNVQNARLSLSEFEGETDDIFLRLRKMGRLSEAYLLYKKNESMQPCGLYKMTPKAEEVMGKIDYKKIITARKRNFNRLHEALLPSNGFEIERNELDVPFLYPFLPKFKLDFEDLYNQQIYFPRLWDEILTRKEKAFEWEKKLSVELIPLPIDHRYNEDDMDKLIFNILTLIN